MVIYSALSSNWWEFFELLVSCLFENVDIRLWMMFKYRTLSLLRLVYFSVRIDLRTKHILKIILSSLDLFRQIKLQSMIKQISLLELLLLLSLQLHLCSKYFKFLLFCVRLWSIMICLRVLGVYSLFTSYTSFLFIIVGADKVRCSCNWFSPNTA